MTGQHVDSRPRLLVADDDMTVRFLAQEILEQAGFEVGGFENGREALAAFFDWRPRLVLLDVMMPEIDGFSVCSAIRASEEGADIPIVMITGNDDIESIQHAYEAGATDFVAKPINWLILGHRLRYMLRAHETLGAFRQSQSRNRALLDAIPDLILVLDGKGLIVNFKAAATLSPLFSVEEFSGVKKVTDVLHAEFAQLILSRIEPALSSGELQRIDYPFSSGGRQFYYEARIVRSGDHEVLTIIQDVTTRKAAEEALRESERKYRTLFEESHDAIYITNREGKFLDFNRAALELLGYSEEEMSNLHFSQVCLEPEALIRLYREIDEKGSIRDYEEELRRKDGGIMSCLLNATICSSHGVGIDGYQGIIRDITAAKRHQEEIQHSMEKLRKAMKGTIQVISSTVECKDPYTAGHQRRVADLARAIATMMNLCKDQIDAIRIAGIIHDLGKISIPAEILSKPGRLSEPEFNIIKSHPVVGFEILKTIDFPWPIANIVYQHHERLNGSGYPQGLKGEEILLESRILAVADVVEAMASHRPYRPMLGLDKALEEITQNKGVLYDPVAADMCVRLLKEEGFSFDRHVQEGAGESETVW